MDKEYVYAVSKKVSNVTNKCFSCKYFIFLRVKQFLLLSPEDDHEGSNESKWPFRRNTL